MKILAPVVIIALGLLLLIPQVLFTVDETQLAIVTRFGEPRRSINSPGLYVKTPFFDSATKFDKRLLHHNLPPDSLLTKDKKNLVIDAYTRYRIVDPLLFFQKLQNELRAQSRVGDIVASELRREIAQDNQSEIISENREAIINRVRDASNRKVLEEQFGIEIVDVRIKRADFPEAIAQSIYARMQAERERIAKQFRAEGAEEDAKIRAEVDKQKAIILAEAEKQSNITRGQGEAQAIEIFSKALEKDPEFYAFRRSLEAYKVFLKENTTLVLSADSDLFKYLQSALGSVQSTATGGTKASTSK